MDRSKFYDAIRGPKTTVFGKSLSRSQVAGMEGILDAMEEVGDGRKQTLCYALATAYHETGTRMEPVREGFCKTDASAITAVKKLAKKRGSKSSVARYCEPVGPYGKTYYGRGYVQLTWLENYKSSSADAMVDLVKDPDAMLVPKISARILILGLIDGRWNGTRKGIAHYLPTDGAEDLKYARQTVNGTDCWEKIATYYKDFRLAVTAAGGLQSDKLKNQPTDIPKVTPVTAQPSSAMANWLESCPGNIQAIGRWLAEMPEADRS